MKRTLATWGAITAVAALALTGCGAATTGGTSPEGEAEPTTISVAAWSVETTPEFGVVIDAFEEANPEITVEVVDILASDYIPKVTTMLAGGDTTDVLGMKSIAQFRQYAQNGQLLDLTELSETVDSEALTGLDTYDVDGKYFALPYRWDSWILFYNKDLFDAAGEEYPIDLTWDEYVKLAEKMTTGEGESKVWGTFHVLWNQMVQSISAVQTDSDLNGGDYEFMTDQYDLAIELQDSGAAMDFGTVSTQKASYVSLFGTGKTAMVPMGTWLIPATLSGQASGDATIENWGMAAMPQLRGAEGVTTMGTSTGFAVNKNSKNAEAAKKFVAFAAGEEGAKALAAIGTSPSFNSDSVIDSLFALPGMPTDEDSKKAFTPDVSILDTPQTEDTPEISQIQTETHQLIMTGQKSVADGIREMDERVNNEVLNQ